eukprot:TRINITY_DN86664_c0_g1_i1.p1 TRINITY_DN86664_c0_g1~~TRINITY_DN86664_c0_g1_i1.p1  ORF type:complete len:127 (+),score=29.30 TRINITY_DN86664_c0_g1_i1:82-462(+)
MISVTRNISSKGCCAPLRAFLLLTMCAVVMLIAGQPCFASPRVVRTGGSSQVPKGSLSTETATAEGKIDARVEDLRKASFEACLRASENNPEEVERCRELSYELSVAEQLQLKRHRAFRYVDYDSF